MQKSRIYIGASAAILAIASAFSTKNINKTTHPYHLTRLGSCVTFANPCTGGTKTVWTQGSNCKSGAKAFTDNGCSVTLKTNPN